MAFVLVAKWTAKAGEEDRVRSCLERLAGPSREEPGCRFYQPCQDPESPGTFLIFEIYDDQAAYEAHGASEHFQADRRRRSVPAAREPRARRSTRLWTRPLRTAVPVPARPRLRRRRCRLLARSSPELVQPALHLEQPDDAAHERYERPEPGHAGDRLRLARLGVHVADVRGQEEDRDGDQRQQQADDAARALAAMRPNFRERDVDPVQQVDAERHDREQQHGEWVAVPSYHRKNLRSGAAMRSRPWTPSSGSALPEPSRTR